MNNEFWVKIKQIDYIAKDTYQVMFYFEKGSFRYSPGQYIWVVLESLSFPDQRGTRRAFSISSSVGDLNTFTIQFRNTNSGFKNTLLSLPIGTKVKILGPYGSSFIPSNEFKNVVMIAGGVGIAPFLSILRSLKELQNQTRYTVMYLNSAPESGIFFDELNKIATENNYPFINHIGDFRENILPMSVDYSTDIFFISGPVEMVNEVYRILSAKNVPFEHMHFEQYYPIFPGNLTESDFILKPGERNIMLQAVQESKNHVIVTDINGQIIFANKKAQGNTGFTFDEMRGNTPRLWGSLMPKEFYQKLWIKKHQAGGFDGEMKNRRKNGELYTVIAHITPVIDSNGAVIGYIGTEEDISERVKVEEALKREKLWTHEMFASSIDGIEYINLDGILLEVNEAFCRITGYTKEELINKKTYQDITPSEFHKMEEVIVKNVIESGQGSEYEKEFLRKDGTRVSVIISIFIVKDAQQVIGLAGFVKDISERKRLENGVLEKVKIIEEEKTRDEVLISSLGEGLIVTDQQGIILKMNPAAEELLGYSLNDFIGKSLCEVIEAEDENGQKIKNADRPLYKVLLTRQKVFQSMIYKRKDDQKVIVSVAVTPVILGNTILGTVTVFRDITREKKIDQAKSEFISLASHQLRTPLTAMKWFTEMLLAGDAGVLSPKQLEFIKNVDLSNERMIALVNSLLNISRIESGRLIIDPKLTDLHSLTNTVVDELKEKLLEKKLVLNIKVGEELPLINIDPEMIAQVLVNLLTNAIKYTPIGGQIEVYIYKDKDHLVTKVTDNGVGIPITEQPKIFERFFRASNAVQSETDGTGLGLYMAKAIIESSNGIIGFDSKIGKGTVFWFSLPIIGVLPKKGEVKLSN